MSLPLTLPRVGMREGLMATAGLLLSLWIGKHLAAATGFGDVIFTLIAAFQLYVPLWLIQRAGEAPESHGIHTHGLLLGPIAALRSLVVRGRRQRTRAKAPTSTRVKPEPATTPEPALLRPRRRRGRPGPFARLLAYYGRGAVFRPRAFFEDIGRAVVVAGLTFPLFAVGYHFWQQLMGNGYGGFNTPEDLGTVLLKQTFLIALPEELFYRGFLETRLERMWPTKRSFLGLPIGRTVVLASFLFALGHFLGEYNPARFGPFFPAFVFSMLVRRSHSISGAILYHGLSNACSYYLLSGYHR